MPYSEADTRAKLIDPALHARGWTEDFISREETEGAIWVEGGKARKEGRGRVDYVLRVVVKPGAQPVALALIEAKAEDKPAGHGLEQAKLYADSRRFNIQFVYASNGHQYVEFDRSTGLTTEARPLAEFPSPETLRGRYEQTMGFSLAGALAKPLLMPYQKGEKSRRYYQDAAIRAILEKIARGEKRALLSLATGSGKTFIAVNLLRKIADAEQLKRALFVCDRNELRKQGYLHFYNAFGNDAAVIEEGKPQKNARVLIGTYQTLDVDTEDAEANFLVKNYPENYFSHIVIDECHRSAWGKWSQVLTRNPDAVQVGLTATPRQLKIKEKGPEAEADARLMADNLRYFGEPVYEYDMAQGIKDGYLAACEVVKRDVDIDAKALTRQDIFAGHQPTDFLTGAAATVADVRPQYGKQDFEDKLVLPDRVAAMCMDFFIHLVKTGGPEQKSIIFCARDHHAELVAAVMNNIYALWCEQSGQPRRDPYAFKCTAQSGGSQYLADLRGAQTHHFIATTVELLTTGVDVPCVRNIVFFKYVRSPIAFYQMVGRGTRLHPETGKLMFRVYDYTNASRLFGGGFVTAPPATSKKGKGPEEPPVPPEKIIRVAGFDVHVTDAGRYIVTDVDGKATPVPLADYKQMLAAALVKEAPDVNAFRQAWVEPPLRRALVGKLPENGRSALLVRALDEMEDYDLFDVLGDLGYGISPHTRAERGDAFVYKNGPWLNGLPIAASATVKALVRQFQRGGTEELEDPRVLDTPEVVAAGGFKALSDAGDPKAILHQTRERVFVA
jgi:type I restriction enzyme R subunit